MNDMRSCLLVDTWSCSDADSPCDSLLYGGAVDALVVALAEEA